MAQEIQGLLNAQGRKFAVIVSRFNELISEKLLAGALDCLLRHQANEKDITVYWAPGSFEIPLLAKKAANSGKFNAVICLGAVIRGGTPHFEYIASEVSKGIAQVALSSEMPVIFGVITADSIEQALERAGTKAGNRGWYAALSAIEMADLLPKM